jgi:ElaB/YqjD/DUF883 family membrane-anchored ribosome-binding protein
MTDNLAIVQPGATQHQDRDQDQDREQDRGDGASDEINRLEAEIELKRERVAASLGELRRRVTSATDWRHWIQEHPFAWIAAGLSLGFVVGLAQGRDRNR